jgi:hypothetical protein
VTKGVAGSTGSVEGGAVVGGQGENHLERLERFLSPVRRQENLAKMGPQRPVLGRRIDGRSKGGDQLV